MRLVRRNRSAMTRPIKGSDPPDFDADAGAPSGMVERRGKIGVPGGRSVPATLHGVNEGSSPRFRPPPVRQLRVGFLPAMRNSAGLQNPSPAHARTVFHLRRAAHLPFLLGCFALVTLFAFAREAHAI